MWNIQTSRCLIIETSNRPPSPPPSPAYTFRERSSSNSSLLDRSNRGKSARRKKKKKEKYSPWWNFSIGRKKGGGRGERLETLEGRTRLVEICIFEGEKGDAARSRGERKREKKTSRRTFCGFEASASKRQKVCPCLTTFRFSFHGLHTGEILVKPSCCSFPFPLARSRALCPSFSFFFLFFTSSLSLFLFRLVAGGRLHARCFHSLCRSNRRIKPP